MEFHEGQAWKTTGVIKKEVPEAMVESVAEAVPLFEAEARGGPQAWNEVIKPLYRCQRTHKPDVSPLPEDPLSETAKFRQVLPAGCETDGF